jgi:hypothetical protein
MRRKGISQIVRVGTLSAAVLVALSGVGSHFNSGVVEAQKQGQGKQPPPIQAGSGNPPGTMTTLGEQPTVVADPIHARMDEERMKAMNDDRHKKLAADVERMMALTNELKSDVDKTNKDELSVEVIRKAGEIEKLAHDVQARMKN